MMHLLMLRVKFSNGQYGHRLIAKGTRSYCEQQGWFTNIEGFRGPGIVKAELIITTREAWDKIVAISVPRREDGRVVPTVRRPMSRFPVDANN